MATGNTQARTIVITGGGGGIGRSLALICGARGDKVVVLDRDLEAARETAGEALGRGAPDALALACDVTEEEQIEAAYAVITERMGGTYGLFANAAIGMRGMIHELSAADWRKVIEVNVTGVFLSCKHGLRSMLNAKIAGSIVCTSSPTGFAAVAGGGGGPYSSSKGAVSSLVRCMAIDYAPYCIRVNALVPGATETKLMWGITPAAEVSRIREQLEQEIPLGRMAQPNDPARAAAWLMSDESTYVTGSHLVCDGGILAKASIST